MVIFNRQDAAVFGLAFAVRSLFLAVFACFGMFGKPFDTSATLAAYGCAEGDLQRQQTAPGVLQRLAVWDSVFFTRISQCGYEYEQYHAFFPLLPMLLRVLHMLTGGGVVLIGLLLSLFCTSGSCLLLFRLSLRLYDDLHFAALATLLYCFNPASVFHSAVYTESCFAVVFFLGLLFLHRRPWVGATLLALSTAARSNGIVGVCFVAHQGLRRLCHLPQVSAAGVARIVIQTAACGALVALPFLGFQYFGYCQFCHGAETDPDWCAARLPYLYGYVQRRYWGVGFLRYFEVSQVPNFLVATPVLLLSACGCCHYANDHGVVAALMAITLPGRQSQKSAGVKQKLVLPLSTGIYVAHWAFLTIFATLFMHVQVATRLLSTCPPLYWYAAGLCHGKHARVVWSYFLVYAVLGLVLFPQFYPWT